jgi:hypothetical protein
MRHLIYISVLADFNKTPNKTSLRRNTLCDLRVIGEMDALVSGKVPRRPLINGIGHRAMVLYWRVAYRHWSMTALVGGLEQHALLGRAPGSACCIARETTVCIDYIDDLGMHTKA